MKKIKQALLQSPEYLLMVAVLFYWVSAARIINPVAIGLLIILVLQLIFKNRIIGLIIPVILIGTSLYMLLALMSEFREFETFNADAQKLLFVGLAYFISTMLLSGMMIYKYLSLELKSTNIPAQQS
ncbi:MAG TPA: hypothetical protein DCG19_13755 [Cryomorphaceae bacterium]|nr:hypothetical protein [Cryomorphaceae bacterium]|tara:strand:+ start:1200 stop:1580 length:381 start_codon:yes stop_codon:yes gene_type:complete